VRRRRDRGGPLCRAYERGQGVASISYAALRIFEPTAFDTSQRWRRKMTHVTTGDDKFRDFAYDDGYRAYLITRREAPSEHRFGSTPGKRLRVHARRALRRASGFLKHMIEAIANSKLRRMERELELRGIRFDRTNDNWVTRHSIGPSGRDD
jgi:hypothetical protein